jgi:MOSC domain-containing protein YiiM
LGKHSGVCLQVISSGTITVGDHLHMIEHDNALRQR